MIRPKTLSFHFILLICLLILHNINLTAQIDSLKNLYFTSVSVDEKLKYLDKITLHFLNNQLDSAKVYASKEVDLSAKNNVAKYSARGYNWLGEAFLREGTYDSALYYFRKSYNVNIKSGNKIYTAYSLQSIGGCYNQKSFFDSAVHFYIKSLNILEEEKDERGVANCHNNLSLAYNKMGKYSLALENTYKAIRIYQGLNNLSGISSSYDRLAAIFTRMEENDSAIYYYKKAINIAAEINRPYYVAHYTNNLGVAFEGINEYDSALLYYHKALKLRNIVGDIQGTGSSYMNIGNILNYKLKHDSALSYFYKSSKIYLEKDYDHGLIHNYFVTGNLFDSIQLFDSAIYYHQKSYVLAVKYDIHEYLRKLALALSYDYNMLDDNESALSYYKIYKNYEDSLFNSESSERIGWVKAKYSFEKELIKEERKREQLWKLILGISVVLIILILLLWFIYLQLRKKKTLIKKLISKDKKIDGPEQDLYKDNTNIIVQSKRQLPDEKTINQIEKKLSEWKNEELFTNHDVSLEVVSKYCNTNTNYLSYIINQTKRVSFTEWVFHLRLKRAKELLADKEKVKTLNISGIAQISGFKNKVTFYKYFSQDMGITPKEYIKSLQ